MAKSTLRQPQFFHTLVPGFHTHLVIPVDFFANYIQGKSVEDTAELKSDSSDITWKVKMSGPRLSDGWEDFAVCNNLQIGDVLLVRYEGDLVFHVSDLGPNCSDTRDVAPPSNKNDVQDVIGKILFKKRLYPRTQVDDDEDVFDTELPRKKKLKKNSQAAEAASSSPSDNSSFVANVTATSLHTDTLYLPEYFTSSNGFTRKCCKIVLIDGGERSWALDLSFSNSSDTFYISRGWRNFCDDNGQEAGGFFMFKLVGSGETPVLSFCPTESCNDRKQRDCSEISERESLATEVSSEEENKIEGESSEDECNSMKSLVETESSENDCRSIETDKTKYSSKRRVVSYSSYSPCHKEFLTFTIPPDYDSIHILSLPRQFTRDNGINKPGKIYLLGKGGKKCLTTLRCNKRGAMGLGKGWRDFVKANGLKTSFTFKLLWNDTTPVLCLCDAESTIDREQEESVFIDSSNIDKIIDSREIPLVTLTITPSSFRKCRLALPKSFTTESDINKPGMITLMGKDGTKHLTKLLFVKARGAMFLGGGLKSFFKENGLKIGDSFTLELIWEDTSPVLHLCTVEHSIKDKKKPMEREKSHLRERESTPLSQNKIVTLKTTPSSFTKCRLIIPAQFAHENSINKPGKICLVGKDGTKWPANLRRDCKGTMSLGQGWRKFGESHDVKVGQSFTMELIQEDATPMLRWAHTTPEDVSAYQLERKKSHLRERDSTPSSQKQFVTLTITPSSFTKCRLTLPAQFVRQNSINKPGMMYLVCKDGTKWPTSLRGDTKGTMGLGSGWKEFCEAHGLKVGESFTVELIWEDATPMLRLAHTESNSSKANKKESVSTEPRGKIQNQFVTLAPTPEDISACQLYLPRQFIKANGINKLGKIIMLGENGMEWSAYLLSKDGLVALGTGWDEFCEANGVKLGESFTLEFINVQDKTSPVLKFCSPET